MKIDHETYTLLCFHFNLYKPIHSTSGELIKFT